MSATHVACELCDAGFPKYRYLMQHMRKIHPTDSIIGMKDRFEAVRAAEQEERRWQRDTDQLPV
jgi:hypothetical protein